MFIKYSLWKSFLLFLSTIHLTITASNYRENLALRHPCITINKRLGPYIPWTEKLASTQYKVQKDACGQIGSGPACCTNEIMTSYALSLGTDLKNLFDIKFRQLTHLISSSEKQIDIWTKEYVSESRRITISSLETLFGTKEYRSNVHHSITTLFKNLADHQSSNDDVSKSAVTLFKHLIISSYRRFMTNNSDLIFDDYFGKCLVNKAFAIEALPTQRELLYTLTSGASLIQILHTLFRYIEGDIQQLKITAMINSNACIQRYAREALCPMCISTLSLPSPVNYDNNVNEPLCENDCRYVIKTCFDPINNPYVAFASIAQGYSKVIKEIQDAVVELKLVDRLSKLHIYLYDMVVNAANTQRTYTQLQHACPDSNEKPFSPLLSLPPIITERRELVTKWNNSLHFLLEQLQTSIDNLNTSLTQQIITDICSNSNYAVKSNRCTQIDQRMAENSSQWPIPSTVPSSSSTSDLDAKLIRNQLDELKKKLTPVQQMMISLRPKKKFSLIEILPDFESYDNGINTNDNDIQSTSSSTETYEIDNQESLSERLYNAIDGHTTRRSTTTKTTESSEEKKFNHSRLMTPNIPLYLIVFLFLIFTESRSLATELDKEH